MKRPMEVLGLGANHHHLGQDRRTEGLTWLQVTFSLCVGANWMVFG